MGPWSVRRKSTNTNEDAVVQRQGPPRQGPGRPSRVPPEPPGSGPGRGNPRTPQDGVNREHEDRGHQARQVVGAPRGGGEGQPEGRAVALSHGRPAQPKRPTTAALGPEASTSHGHHHVSHTPRQTGAFQPQTSSIRYPSSQHDRTRTQSSNSDPRATETMRNKRDNSPVKNIHNVRSNQGTMGSHTRSMGRGGPQPGPVSARGGVPRPSRPPAPSVPPAALARRPGPPSGQEHRPSASVKAQHVTSAPSDRNASVPVIDDTGPRSNQQMGMNPTPRLKGQNRPGPNPNNQNTAAHTSSKVQSTSRTNATTANNDQSRLPNNQSLRTDARIAPQGPSRKIVQKAGNNSNTSRNINTEVHSGQRINANTDMVAGPDTNRHSSSSSSGDSGVKNAGANNARHKQKHKATKRDYVKPENVNSTRTMTVGANPENKEGNRETSGDASGQQSESRNAVLSRDNPSTNADNPTERQVQRKDDTNKIKNRPSENSQVSRQKQTAPRLTSLTSQQQRQDQRSENDQSKSGQRERTESSEAEITRRGHSEATNSRNKSQTLTSQTAGPSESSTPPSGRSSEGQTGNSSTEGARERTGGSGQSTTAGRADITSVDRENNSGIKQRSTTSGERSNNSEIAHRSNGPRMGLNEGSGLRGQRIPPTTTTNGEPSSNSAVRNSRATSRSANAQSNSTALVNNTTDSTNNVESPTRRAEATGVNNGIRNNTTNSSNRKTVHNNSGNNMTTTVQSNNNCRPSNAQNSSSGNTRITGAQNSTTSNTRPSAVQNSTTRNTRPTPVQNSGNTSRPSVQTRAAVQNNSANTSGARVSNQNRVNMSSSAIVHVNSSSSGTSHQQQQQRRTHSGVVLDPGQLHIDIVDNSPVSVSDQPPPYSTLDVHSSGNRRNNRSNRQNSSNPPNQALPDILNSHVHPPRQNESRSTRRGGGDGANTGNRDGGPRRSRAQSAGYSSRQPPRGTTRLDSTSSSCEGCTCSKWGCLQCLTVITTFRRILITLALLGVCCVLTGIVLGALHMTIGSSFLTLSLMFIGLGVMLVIVVGVGWKCTPRGHEPCHLLFSLGDHSTDWNDIHLQTSTRSRSNPRNQWVGGTIYDEFQYRRPPPSYNASMQEYQQQLVLAQIQQSTQSQGPDTPNSPPPTYKSHASTVRPGLHITFPILQGNDYPSSRPPTYRSTAGTLQRPRINTNPEGENERAEGVNNRGTEANQEQIMNELNSNHSRPDTPASSTTLQRANQVVNYLDDVLDNSIREMERENVSNSQEAAERQCELRNNSTNTGDCTTVHSSSTSSAPDQSTSINSVDNEAVQSDTAGTNSTDNGRRNSTTTTATSSNSTANDGSNSTTITADSSNSTTTITTTSTSGSSSGSMNSGATTSEGSNRHSSSSQTSGDSSHIVADTHL